jgi:hypothetical protein
MSDSSDLQRFVDAQAAIYPRVVEELLRDENRHTGCGVFFPDRRSRLQRRGSTLRSARAPRPSLTWSVACSGPAWSNAHAPSWLQAKRP